MADILAKPLATLGAMFLIVPHLFPDPRLLEAAARGLRLPGLEALLARGRLRDAPAEGPEAALCEALGVARQQDWPIAALALAAEGEDPGAAWWLRADPVHLQVMRDRIVLAGSELLDLTHAEAEALAASIGRHFGAGLMPRVRHPHRWYLSFDVAPDLRTTPLAAAVGRDIGALLPQGTDAGLFRARLNELQMLLHAHPVNQAREARGAPTVNSLWLWGGGHAPALAIDPPRVYAQDAAIRALASRCGAQSQVLPEKLPAEVLATRSVVVLDDLSASGQAGDAWGWREAVRTLDSTWFMLLRTRLRSVGPHGLALLDPVHGKMLGLAARDAWRIWRRSRPLLEGPLAG